MKTGKVILIGKVHYHGLGLARCFGEKGIKPYGIIVGECSDDWMQSSRYWEKLIYVDTDEEALDYLLENFGDSKVPDTVIAWSDASVSCLDLNIDRLKGKFIYASIQNTSGQINAWMQKDKQVELAHILGLPSAQTAILNIPLQKEEYKNLLKKLKFPYILKPVASYEGKKTDIRRIDDSRQLKAYISVLQEKGYHRVLVQEFLEIETEYDFMGYVNNASSAYAVIKKERNWPAVGGSTCFGKIIAASQYEGVFEQIVKKLSDFGYSGMFDMDLFLVNGQMYFNEINWRSSANVFAALACGINYPYEWYLSRTDHEREEIIHEYKGEDLYLMNEIWDFRLVQGKYLTFLKWISDVRKTKAFAFYNKNDKKPFIKRIASPVEKKINGIKARKNADK